MRVADQSQGIGTRGCREPAPSPGGPVSKLPYWFFVRETDRLVSNWVIDQHKVSLGWVYGFDLHDPTNSTACPIIVILNIVYQQEPATEYST